mmetsp:Transcript_139/g.287  ORF Transcript_139/g.287 Transcript_139/m.287 type:complete len:634 (-) Transcript_139:75-1976(-)|eukprot:CAMPEP_0201520030 /NCGR_PEP_ID=MMETSP0161_2-20130828/10439_1 /ASSEMBLY_ACC=CAM_ASM_000251 /TAXON_ID=180227 /ORGANISM="Neoparamoeba aestuarina, Strain SoJaBio B1-5/56/2" /LENGTH=633 /DNA_ID=CAMNT_0047918269 /DNA_START=45 /DNA_END=1946 /DNA_ORIENTATION=+
MGGRNSFLFCVLVFLFLFFELNLSRPVLQREGDDASIAKREDTKERVEKQQQDGEDDEAPSTEGYYFKDPSYYLQWHLQNLGAVKGEDLIDLDIVKAWKAGYDGSGVIVGVVDSQMDHNLPDLKENIVGSLCKDFNFGTPDSKWPDHAAAVSGLIAAEAGNKYCGAGVAYNAGLALLRLLDGSVSDATEAAALSYQNDEIDIYSCNWGPSDDGDTLAGPGPLTADVLEQGAKTGRNNKGSIYVWAAGNGNQRSDNCNYDGYANSPYTIAVGSVNSYGVYSSFSEPCAAMLTTAPGGEETDDSLVGITTTDSQDCASDFTGTDYAAPQVAGVVALMLQANPDLSWRDVQAILIESSRIVLNGEEKGTVNGWQLNGGGLYHHDHYGFGFLNASEAVFKAEDWVTNSVRRFRYCYNSSKIRINQEIPQNGTTVSTFWKVNTLDETMGFYLEHVRVFFSATHSAWGDLAINLTSPMGTISKLATVHAQNNKESATIQYDEWPFMTVKNWGENPTGNWFLTIGDEVADDYSGKVDSWQLEICGYYQKEIDAPTPTPPPITVVENKTIVETEYEQNRSFTEQIAAIFWRFLIIIMFLGILIVVFVFFVSPRSFESYFGSLRRRGPTRDSEGIFDSGDDL